MGFNILDFNLPIGWKYVRLGDIATINPELINKKSNFDFIKYIDISSVSSHFFESPKEILFSEAPSRARRKLENNDFIISTVRPNLKQYAFLDKVEENWVCSTGLCVVRAKDENTAWYLYAFVTSDIFNEYLIRIADGGAYPAFNPKEIENVIIPLPDDGSLQKIAKFIKNINNKVSLNTQINQTLEQIAQAIFKSWFVDFDPVKAKINVLANGGTKNDAERAAMCVISGKTEAELTQLQDRQPEKYQELAKTAALFPSEMVESELGKIPKGWGVKSLEQIAHYQNGLALQKFRPKEGENFLLVVKIAELKKGFTDGIEKASIDIKPECIIDNGDVIFSWSGSLVVDFWCGGKAALNQHLFKVTSENYPKWFYYLYTKYHLAEFQRIAQDKAVTMGHIKREHLSLALCCIPSLEVINNILVIRNLLDEEIENRLENFRLSETRDTLLPKLLSGSHKFVL